MSKVNIEGLSPVLVEQFTKLVTDNAHKISDVVLEKLQNVVNDTIDYATKAWDNKATLAVDGLAAVVQTKLNQGIEGLPIDSTVQAGLKVLTAAVNKYAADMVKGYMEEGKKTSINTVKEVTGQILEAIGITFKSLIGCLKGEQTKEAGLESTKKAWQEAGTKIKQEFSKVVSKFTDRVGTKEQRAAQAKDNQQQI